MEKLVTKEGTCKYCKQMRQVNIWADATQEEVDKEATNQCDCPQAQDVAKKEMKVDAAITWAQNMLEKNEDARDVAISMIKAVVGQHIAQATMKVGKHTYTFKLNGDGDIVAKREFKDSQEETF